MTKQVRLGESGFGRADDGLQRSSPGPAVDEGSSRFIRGLATAIAICVPIWALAFYLLAG